VPRRDCWGVVFDIDQQRSSVGCSEGVNSQATARNGYVYAENDAIDHCACYLRRLQKRRRINRPVYPHIVKGALLELPAETAPNRTHRSMSFSPTTPCPDKMNSLQETMALEGIQPKLIAGADPGIWTTSADYYYDDEDAILIQLSIRT